jgi:hypothetical protein
MDSLHRELQVVQITARDVPIAAQEQALKYDRGLEI